MTKRQIKQKRKIAIKEFKKKRELTVRTNKISHSNLGEIQGVDITAEQLRKLNKIFEQVNNQFKDAIRRNSRRRFSL